MSIKIEWIGNFNPFDFIACPTCGGKEFTSLSLGSAWCDNCNTQFSVRHTAGDPGCVVDADTEDAYGPVFRCPTCSYQAATLAPGIHCPSCKKPMERKEGYSGALMENPPRKWCMILKTGDYCSG
jgi:DNA-directed RNA polymerase subunit RPC12/RpoP